MSRNQGRPLAIGSTLGSCLLALAPVFAAPAEEGDFVRPGQPLEEIRGSNQGTVAGRPAWSQASPSGAGAALLQMAYLALGLAAAGGGALFLYRRFSGRGRRLPGSIGIEVVGRAALTHKHYLFVVRVANRSLVVGVAGEHMTPMAVIPDGAAATGGEEAPFAEAPLGAGGGAGSKPPGAEGLGPYRQEWNRLRHLFRDRLAGATGGVEAQARGEE